MPTVCVSVPVQAPKTTIRLATRSSMSLFSSSNPSFLKTTSGTSISE